MAADPKQHPAHSKGAEAAANYGRSIFQPDPRAPALDVQP
jgi:hypothetical protein